MLVPLPISEDEFMYVHPAWVVLVWPHKNNKGCTIHLQIEGFGERGLDVAATAEVVAGMIDLYSEEQTVVTEADSND